MARYVKSRRLVFGKGPSVLYMAFELSHKIWKLAFSDGQKTRTVSMEARNLEVLQEEIEKAKKKFKD